MMAHYLHAWMLRCTCVHSKGNTEPRECLKVKHARHRKCSTEQTITVKKKINQPWIDFSLKLGFVKFFLTFQRQKTSMPKMVRPKYRLNPMMMCVTVGGSFWLLCASSFTCNLQRLMVSQFLTTKAIQMAPEDQQYKKNWVHYFYSFSYETHY